MNSFNESKVVYLTTRSELINFINNNQYVVVKLTATWCGPCKRIKPFVDKCIAILPDEVKVVFVDGDQGADILRYLKWRAFPTFGNFINGEPMDILEGANQEKVLRFFQKTLARYNSV